MIQKRGLLIARLCIINTAMCWYWEVVRFQPLHPQIQPLPYLHYRCLLPTIIFNMKINRRRFIFISVLACIGALTTFFSVYGFDNFVLRTLRKDLDGLGIDEALFEKFIVDLIKHCGLKVDIFKFIWIMFFC